MANSGYKKDSENAKRIVLFSYFLGCIHYKEMKNHDLFATPKSSSDIYIYREQWFSIEIIQKIYFPLSLT